jgi:GNAT superfamily N-acetyltransferase
MENVEIRPVRTGADFRKFFNLPGELYKNDPAYVEPLRMDMKKLFNKKKNPFYKHGEAQPFLAYRGKKAVGSIAALENTAYNEYQKSKTGFFMSFECIDDKSVAGELLRTAESWLKKRGLTEIVGPVSFSTETISPGILIKGFEYSPYLLMAHSLPYYAALVESAGYKKAMDTLAFSMTVDQPMNKRMVELAERIKRTRNITIREVDPKNFYRDAEIITEIYKLAWADNWGFVPPSEEELKDIVKSMKQIYMKEFAFIAEIDGEPVGWAVTLPNINEALIHMKGRLFPFGIFKLLYWYKKIKSLRLWGLGIKPEYRRRGVDALLYYHTLAQAQKLNYREGEMSWVLETNVSVIQAVGLVAGEEYKRYRIYAKDL